jgi:hypothetical protein
LIKLWMFVLRLSCSGKAFHVAFATQAQEAFLHPASAVRGHTTLIAETDPQVNDLRSADPDSESPKA